MWRFYRDRRHRRTCPIYSTVCSLCGPAATISIRQCKQPFSPLCKSFLTDVLGNVSSVSGCYLTANKKTFPLLKLLPNWDAGKQSRSSIWAPSYLLKSCNGSLGSCGTFFGRAFMQRRFFWYVCTVKFIVEEGLNYRCVWAIKV